jgi:hypothetical protein
MAAFARDCQAQIDLACAFAVQELRLMATGIREGNVSISPAKPKPLPVIAAPAPPPTRTVFCLRSIKWRDNNGRLRTALQYEDVELPLHLADKTLRRLRLRHG